MLKASPKVDIDTAIAIAFEFRRELCYKNSPEDYGSAGRRRIPWYVPGPVLFGLFKNISAVVSLDDSDCYILMWII